MKYLRLFEAWVENPKFYRKSHVSLKYQDLKSSYKSIFIQFIIK